MGGGRSRGILKECLVMVKGRFVVYYVVEMVLIV
jgi:hypothetical protein